MSNLIAGLRSIREDEATQFRLLRRFLAENHIRDDVSNKVTQFLQHQFAKSQKARHGMKFGGSNTEGLWITLAWRKQKPEFNSVHLPYNK